MERRVPAQIALRNAVNYWTEFVAKCISQRLETDQFETFVQLVYSKHTLPASAIADFFLRPQLSNCVSLDPRIPPYIQVLTQLRYINAPSILKALYKYSTLHTQIPELPQQGGGQDQHGGNKGGATSAPSAPPTRWKCSSWAEEVMFYHVIKLVVEGTAFRDERAALDLVKVISKWMALFASASATFATSMLVELHDSQIRHEMEVSRAAFVPLLLRLVDNESFVKVISNPLAKGHRKEFSESLAKFVQTLQPVPQFAEKLEIFRIDILARLDPVDKTKQAANAAMDELLDSTVGPDNLVIPEMPIPNTRSGLYIYLNASLVGRPLLDDHMLFSYLHNRYQGNIQACAVDLILASFDILANAVFRNEGQRDAHLLRSYLINKVPLLLCQLFPPGFATSSAEFCITEALNQVDTSVFPTASLMFDESRNNNPYTESVREEFCSACALHGLIEREHVERILGESSMTYEPSQEKSSKDKLVQGCLSDPEKISSLVRELDKMDGNVGAISQALVELIRQLCNNKETMSLKLLCCQLAQKPQSLDVLLLFEKLPTILEPLCHLLDNWRYEEDQGEYQPVYEEFGSILLLVLAFAYRYNLTPADIGLQSADSSVAKIIGRSHISQELDELTEVQNGHINGWIHGLFDSEAGGLGDDLMSSCPPQEFYFLIATLFQNIVVAYSNDYLTDDTLKSGIEYLVDTFLLPSLIPAIRFLSDYLWIEQKEQKSIIKVLQLIILPSSISGEASTMLSSVKSIIAKPLEHSLRTYQRQDPKNQDIEPLLKALKDSLPLSRRTGGAELNELDAWAVNNSNSGLVGAVKHTIQALVQWSIHPGLTAMPTSYTHRQVIAAVKIVGATKLLRVMVEDLRQHTEAGSGNIAYDVVSSLICAPNVMNEPPMVHHLLDETGNMPSLIQRRLSLREALRMEADDVRKLRRKDPVLAEIVVRLYRRVEAHMVLPPPPAMLQGADMHLDLAGGATSLGDAMAAVAAGVQADGSMAVDSVMGLDMGMGGVSSGLGLGGVVGNNGGLDTSDEADLFGAIDTGLDASIDMFDWSDSMDMRH